MRLLPLLAAALLLTGCVSQAANEVAPADVLAPEGLALTAVRALMAHVPCEADVGSDTSANLLKLGEIAFDSESHEMDVRGTLALLGALSPPSLWIVDVSDPTAPELVTAFEIPGFPLDVKWTPSGDGAYVGTVGELYLVDLTDLEAPVVRSTIEFQQQGPFTPQGHSFSTGMLDGEEWLYVSNQHAPYGTVAIRRDGWDMTIEGMYRTAGLVSGPLGHHDNTIVVDPLLDNKTFLYVAQGFEGWTIADLSDPANPKEVSRALPELGPGYTHMLRAAFIDGKRIVVSMQEAGLNTMSVYDATDLAMPKLIARWTADKTRPHIPQHNIQVQGDYLYMAHYTEGFYVFNLTATVAGAGPLPQLDMPVVAHYAVESPDPPDALGFSDIIDLQLLDGVLIVNDIEDGLFTVGFGCVTPGDPAANALK